MSLPLAFRPAADADVPLILNSWLMSYRNSAFAKAIPNDVYFGDNGHRGRILSLLAGEPYLLVACSPEDEDDVRGWICATVPAERGELTDHAVVHYVYVKQIWRRHGIATRLLKLAVPEGVPVVATHDMPVARKLPVEFTYDPYRMALQ